MLIKERERGKICETDVQSLGSIVMIQTAQISLLHGEVARWHQLDSVRQMSIYEEEQEMENLREQYRISHSAFLATQKQLRKEERKAGFAGLLGSGTIIFLIAMLIKK